MADFKPFFNPLYPAEAIEPRIKVIYDLVAHVMRVTDRQRGGEEPVGARDVFRRSVDAALLPFLRDRIGLPKISKRYAHQLPQPGNTDELVIAALKDGMLINTSPEDIYCPHFSNSTICAAVEKGLGRPVLNLVDDCAPPTVEGAAQMAKINAMETETGIVCITALHTLLKSSEWHDPHLEGSYQLRSLMWRRIAEFRYTAVLYAAMSKDAGIRQEIIKWAAEGTCVSKTHVEYSVISHLRYLGRAPGSYATSEDEAFRKSIKAAYLKL